MSIRGVIDRFAEGDRTSFRAEVKPKIFQWIAATTRLGLQWSGGDKSFSQRSQNDRN
jgi:hypothetical protein